MSEIVAVLRKGLVCSLAFAGLAKPPAIPFGSLRTDAQDAALTGTYRLELRSTRVSMPADKPSIMMLVLEAKPLNLSDVDREAKTYLTQWYSMFIGRQSPANACFTNTKAEGGPPYRSTLAYWWDPLDTSTAHVTMDRSPDDGHELTLEVHGAGVSGRIVHDAGNPGEFNGVEWTVEGARIGPPDPTLCFSAAKLVAAAVIR